MQLGVHSIVIHFLCFVIKKCIQKRTIATITNERGSEEALYNQRVLFDGDVPETLG